MTHRRFISLFVVLVSVASVGESALAVPAPRDRPGAIDGPWLVSGEADLEEVSLEIDCEQPLDPENGPRCSYDYLLRITNPSDTPTTIRTLTYVLHAYTTEIKIPEDFRGEGGDSTETPELNVQANSFAFPARLQTESTAGRLAVSVTLDPGQTLPILLTGELIPPSRWSSDWSYDPLVARHFAFAEPLGSYYEIGFFTEALRSWGGHADLDVDVRVPPSWPALLAGGDGDSPDSRSRSERDLPKDPWSDGTTTKTFQLDETESLTLKMKAPAPERQSGGLYFGAGGYLDDTEGGFVRAGYEFAKYGWLIGGASLDTDMNNFVSGAMTFSAATPGVLILPSAAIGLGPTVQVKSGIDVGGRAQITLHYPFVGVTAHLDYLPTLDDDSRTWQVGLIGRIGF